MDINRGDFFLYQMPGGKYKAEILDTCEEYVSVMLYADYIVGPQMKQVKQRVECQIGIERFKKRSIKIEKCICNH